MGAPFPPLFAVLFSDLPDKVLQTLRLSRWCWWKSRSFVRRVNEKHLRAQRNMCVIKTLKYCYAKHLLHHPSWSLKGTAILIAGPDFILCSCEFNKQFAVKIFGKFEGRRFAGRILTVGLFTRKKVSLSKIRFLSITQKIKLQNFLLFPVLSCVWCCASTGIRSWGFSSSFSIC